MQEKAKPGCLCWLFIYLVLTIVSQAHAGESVPKDIGVASDKPVQIQAIKENGPGTSTWWDPRGWQREKKFVALNLASIGALTVVGFSQWDYGTTKFRFRSEGWFGRNTDYGGADKLEHAWAGYALTSAYSGIYQQWGYSKEDALLRGAASSAAVLTLVEIGDGFSGRYGFSWQDMVMNFAGIGASYLRHTYPDFEKRVDFRIEWRPWETRSSNFFLTDSSSERFLLAFKLGGFIDNPVMRAVDIQIGYYTRGYESKRHERRLGDKHRYGYAGIGLNVTYILERLTGSRAAGIFDYVQVPGTSITTR